MEDGTAIAYCFAKTSGCSGASPRTSTIAIATSMNPVTNVSRKRTFPANFPMMYSRVFMVVEAITNPQRELRSRCTAFEVT